MKLTKLDLWSFGKFHQKNLVLKDGINLIYGPNESGKTTIHQFIVGMFYGYTKYWTKSHSYRKEQDLYAPWYRDQYAGSMEFKVDGSSYRLERNFQKKREDLKVFHLGENKVLEDLNLYEKSRTPELGDHFLRMSEKLFREVFFIPQLGVQQEEMEANDLVNFFYQVNYSQSKKQVNQLIDKLRDKKKSYGTPGQSRSILGSKLLEIEGLKEEEGRYRLKLSRSQENRQEFFQLKEETKNLDEKIKETKETIRRIEGEKASSLDQKKETYQVKLKYLEEKERAEKSREDLSRIRKLKEKYSPKDRKKISQYWVLKKSRIFMVVLFCILAFLIWKKVSLAVFSLVVSLIGLGVNFCIFYLKKQIEEKYQKPMDLILKEVQSQEKNLSLEEDRVLKVYNQALDKMEDMEKANPYLLEPEDLLSQDPSLDRLKSLQEDLIHKMDQKAYLIGEWKKYDYVFKEEEKNLQALQEICEKKKALTKEITEIKRDMEALDELDRIIQELLNQRQKVNKKEVFQKASTYLKDLTEGRYVRIHGLAKTIEVQLREGNTVSYEFLSQGTRDQVSLATRLAMADVFNPGMFIALDDTFNHFDNHRLSLAWDLLADLAKTHQILYFTSRKEEIPKFPCHIINLGGGHE